MKHLQPKTLLVLLSLLSRRRFSQRGLRKLCGGKVSLGLINRIVQDLVRKGFVERAGRTAFVPEGTGTEPKGNERAGYLLADPYGLLRYIALFRSMSELRQYAVSVEAPEETVVKELAGRGAIFCLGTAMERYSPYYRPAEVSFYSGTPKKVLRFLRSARPGQLKVTCYRLDLPVTSGKGPAGALFSSTAKGVPVTAKVQTVMDLFCDGKGAYARPLLKSLWGIEV